MSHPRAACLFFTLLSPAAAQDTAAELEARILRDPIAAAEAMAAEPTPKRGHRYQVVDGKTGKPIPGANVFWCISEPSEGSPFHARLKERFHSGGRPRELHHLALACRFGHKQVVGKDGWAVIPWAGRNRVDVTVLYRGRIYWRQHFDSVRACELHLGHTRWFRIRVRDQRGKPVAGIPVQVCSWSGACLTDSRGLGFALNNPTNACTPTALVAGLTPVRRTIPNEKRFTIADPIDLTLPDCGAVHVTVLDANGNPRNDVIGMRIAREKLARVYLDSRDYRDCQPASILKPSGGIFRGIPVGGHALHVAVKVRGVHGVLRGKVRAPKRAGLVAELTIPGSSILSPRILDQTGKPLAHTEILVQSSWPPPPKANPGPFGVVLRNGIARSLGDLPRGRWRTDAEGRVRFVWPSDMFKDEEKIHLTISRWTPAGNWLSRVRDGKRLALVGQKPGLKDIRLGPPPVLIAGAIVDEDGKPVGGVSVNGPERFRAGADGEFAIHGYHSGGQIYLRFDKGGYKQTVVRSEPTDKPIRVVMRRQWAYRRGPPSHPSRDVFDRCVGVGVQSHLDLGCGRQ